MNRLLRLLTVVGALLLAGTVGSAASPAHAAGTPVFELWPTTYNFNDQPLNTTSHSEEFLVEQANFGSGSNLEISSVGLIGSGASQFKITSDDCTEGFSIVCEVYVSFAPKTTGAQEASLQFVDNATGSPQDATLTGTGVVAEASVSPTTKNFGTANVLEAYSRPSQLFNVQNTGTATLQISSVVITGADASQFHIEGSGCTGYDDEVLPSSACEVQVIFAPTSTGVKTATLSVTDNAPGAPQTATLTGTGSLPPPNVSLSEVAVLTLTSVEVKGQVNPEDQAATYYAEYAPESSAWCRNGSGSPSATSPRALGFEDTEDHEVSVSITGLTSGVEYCAALVATGASGPGESERETFTASILPLVHEVRAQGTSTTTATVTALVDPESQSTTYVVGYDLSGSSYCENGGSYGEHPSYAITPQPLGFVDSVEHEVTVYLANLTPNTQYCATITAANGSGSSSTEAGWFTTSENETHVTGVNYALSVSSNGNGAGTVTGSDVSCSSSCSYSFAAGTAVSLTAVPNSASTFAGWSGACSGKDVCTITLGSSKSISAEFTAGGGSPTPPLVTKVKAPSVKGSGNTSAVDTGYEGVCPTGDATCSFAVTATAPNGKKAASITIGTVTVGVATGATGEFTLKLNAKGERLAKKAKALKVTLKIVARSGSLSAVTITKTIAIRLPKVKNRHSS